MLFLLVPAASAAIHPITCNGNAGIRNGLVDNPARESDLLAELGNPPGLTPDFLNDGSEQALDDVERKATHTQRRSRSSVSTLGLK